MNATKSAVALAVAGLVLAGCGPDVTAPPDDPAPSASESPSPTTSPSPTPSDAPLGVQAVPEGQELLLRDADGEVEIIHTLDPEGESFFVSAAANPGSTTEDATIVTITQAEGMYDIRWMRIEDGQPGDLLRFPSEYAPSPDLAPFNGIGPTVAWSPDGGSIAWIEWNSQGETGLRTVGWSDGPGTGEMASDNASFGIEPIPAGSRILSWVSAGGTMTTIEVSDPDGGTWRIAVERQSDGALALPPGAVTEA